MLGARRESNLVKIVDEIKAAGGSAVYQVTDISKKEEAITLAKKAVEEFGRIDVWVNCAGLMPLSELSKGKS